MKGMSLQKSRINSRVSVRERLLLAAEFQFALHGARARVIDILETAGSGNTAAINYYFGSREGLLSACRVYREEPLNRFRARLLAAMCEQLGEESFGLAHYFFLLIAPSVAVIRQELPSSYYGRFVASCNTYSFQNLSERQNEEWAKTVRHIVRRLYALLNTVLPPEVIALRVSLYESHIAQGLAKMEALLMQRLQQGDSLAVVRASSLALAAELSRQMVYTLLQEKAGNIDCLAESVEIFQKLLQSSPSIDFCLPELQPSPAKK
ncbi:MAG: AcrR family transcriptional regulator [Paracoccaceae bacterium]|jgi:AcrR family transcriptional regulator